MGQHNTQHAKTLGNYMGKPIFAKVQKAQATYEFDRIAEYIDDGYPLSQLGKSEILLEPGLIYHRAV